MKECQEEFLRRVELAKDDDGFSTKVKALAEAFDNRNALVYTGSGINTGTMPSYCNVHGCCEPDATPCHKEMPSLCHILLKFLLNNHKINHLLSENTDGLHLRSGIPQKCLSEINGNKYLEYCDACKEQYVRNYDVTEQNTDHASLCTIKTCKSQLSNTLVDGGNLGDLKIPHNWQVMDTKIKMARSIVIFGSSCEELISENKTTKVPKFGTLFPRFLAKQIFVIHKGKHLLDERDDVIKIEEDCDVVAYILAEKFETKFTDAVMPYCCKCDPVLNGHLVFKPFTNCQCGQRELDQEARKQYNEGVELMKIMLPFCGTFSPDAYKRLPKCRRDSPAKKRRVELAKESQQSPWCDVTMLSSDKIGVRLSRKSSSVSQSEVSTHTPANSLDSSYERSNTPVKDGASNNLFLPVVYEKEGEDSVETSDTSSSSSGLTMSDSLSSTENCISSPALSTDSAFVFDKTRKPTKSPNGFQVTRLTTIQENVESEVQKELNTISVPENIMAKETSSTDSVVEYQTEAISHQEHADNDEGMNKDLLALLITTLEKMQQALYQKTMFNGTNLRSYPL